jgi:hypothetical protein
MKTLLLIAVTSMAVSGTSFIPAPQENKGQTASISTPSQSHDFSFFRIHRQGKGNVVLAWGVTSLNGVSGFSVERSYDGDFYDAINQVPCNGALKHDWKDENVFPGTINYRIACIMDDGSVHYSAVEQIRIVQH